MAAGIAVIDQPITGVTTNSVQSLAGSQMALGMSESSGLESADGLQQGPFILHGVRDTCHRFHVHQIKSHGKLRGRYRNTLLSAPAMGEVNNYNRSIPPDDLVVA